MEVEGELQGEREELGCYTIYTITQFYTDTSITQALQGCTLKNCVHILFVST